MARHPFDELMELDTADIRLDCAALHLSRDAYPHLDMVAYLRQLDELAGRVADQRPGLAAPLRYQALRDVLVEREDFRGDADDYYNPENSYLNRVLDRRRGIPISLSCVWLEVARRLKWPVRGVGFPGHFLIRFDDPERFVIVDPFRDGRTLSLEDCRRLLNEQFEGKVPFSESLLAPIDTRAILGRALNNLRSVHLRQRNWERLETVLLRLIAVEPNNPRHVQELAAVLYQRGELRAACVCLSTYLERWPAVEGAKEVRRELEHLQAALALMN